MKAKIIILSLILTITSATAFAQSANWQVVGSMPVHVSGGEAVPYGNRILILGGYSDSLKTSIDLIQAFDPYDRTWEVIGNLKEKRAGFISARINWDILIAGGNEDTATSSLQKINLLTNPISFTPITEYSINRGNASGAVVNNKLVTTGGYPIGISSIADSSYLIEYDLELNQVTYKYNHSYKPAEYPTQQITAAAGDFLYIAGGSFNGISSQIYRFGIFDHAYTKLNVELTEPRAGGRAVFDGEKSLIIIGGYNETSNALKSVEALELYNGTGFISQMPPLNYARKEFMAALYNDRIYVFGGTNQEDKPVYSVEMISIMGSTNLNKNRSGAWKFSLGPVYPNPFNPSTTVSFSVGNRGFLSLKVYSSLGELVKTLTAREYEPGNYRIIWDGTDEFSRKVPSSVYFCRLETAGYSETTKMILIK